MLDKLKSRLGSRSREDDATEMLAKHRDALAKIARHVGVDLSDAADLDRSVTAICEEIDRKAGREARKIEAGSEERSLSADVCKINLEGCADVVILPGVTPSITIRTDDKEYLPKVLTSVSGNTLTIDTEPTLIQKFGGMTQVFKGRVSTLVDGDISNASGKYVGCRIGSIVSVGGAKAEVTVVLPEVRALRIKGSGKASFRACKQEKLSIELTGSGEVDLAGSADRLEIDISGSGSIAGFGLETKVANLRVSGSGDIHATATESVRARVSGSGKIKIAGSPGEKDTDVTGSGKIKFVDKRGD